VISKFFTKKPEEKTGILQLPADRQKKLFKKAAEGSTKRQVETLRKYDSKFGERINRG
jgi:hypothetical protein